MEWLGPAALGLGAVVVVAWLAGLRRRPWRRSRRTPMTSQSDWTGGGDGSD